MPLFPLSPERVNGTRPPYDGKLPQSPSLPEFGKGNIDPSVFINRTSTPPRHSRNNSEAHVGSMVARFDSLSIKDYKQRDEVAIKRVEMAREMAELERDRLKGELKDAQEEIRKYKEEARRTKRELEESKERERKVVKRLDVVMEELQRAKENHNLAVGIYEKEIRRTKKEAFKSGSGMVKLQEELRAARASLNVVKANLETEKAKSSRKEQDTFSAQYQLVGLQEELQKTQERMRVIEEERDALKTSLKEEEIARIAAEGQIALPAEEEDDDLLASPMKSPRKPSPVDGEDKENIMPKRKGQQAELKALQEELLVQRRMRQRAEEQVDFMKMECQFRCCSCRLAEIQGAHYVHDNSFDAEMERIKQSLPIAAIPEVRMIDVQIVIRNSAFRHLKQYFEDFLRAFADIYLKDEAVDVDMDQTLVPESQNDHNNRRKTEMLISFSSPKPHIGLRDVQTPAGDSDSLPQVDDVAMDGMTEDRNGEKSDIMEQVAIIPEESDDEEPFSTPPESATNLPSQEQPPQTPLQHEFRTVTTTTTIPIHFNSPFPSSEAHQPTTPVTVAHPPLSQPLGSPFPSKAFKEDGTLDREAALEQIRQRRGRARSVAMGYATPRKQMVEGVGPNGRRDISAPALRAWTKG